MNSLAIINAKAGLLKGLKDPSEVRAQLDSLDHNTEIRVIAGDQLPDVLADVRDNPPERLIIAGGDGTVATFWRELIDLDITYGLIPTGSLNNIATSIGIPDDPKQAVRIINAGKTAKIDIGRANGQVFFESVGVGLLADIMDRIGEQDSKKEVVKTTVESLKQILTAEPFKVNAAIDGVVQELDTMWLTVTNSGRAAAVEIDPKSDMTDGMLEITYCKPIGLADLPAAVNTFLLNTHIKDGPFERLKGREISLRFGQPTNVHIDGEIQILEHMDIRVVPQSIRMLIP